MKTKITLIIFCLGITLFSCKKESELQYLYSDREALVNCESPDKKLLEEALFSFEEDLLNYYDPEKRNFNLCHNRFMSAYRLNKLDFTEMVSQHSKDVFNELKKHENLWNLGHKDGNLNHSLEIYKCIGENIIDEDIKETYNALINANSMSYRMIGEPLRDATYSLNKDKYLSMFIALEMYYANFFDIDFTKPKVVKAEKANPEDAK